MCPTISASSPRAPVFEQTYLAYRALMFRLARDILGDDALAEDAVSDALVKLLEHYDCVSEPVSPRTRRYVAVLTEHAALDLWRKRRREKLVPPEALPEQGRAEADPELRLQMAEALDSLPNEQRTAVLLHLTCGLTAKQVAEHLLCSQAKAEKLISRGKDKLRRQLREAEV